MKTRKCPACGGQGQEQGGLGNLLHFRCRDCGIWFSRTVKPKTRGQRWAEDARRFHGLDRPKPDAIDEGEAAEERRTGWGIQ